MALLINSVRDLIEAVGSTGVRDGVHHIEVCWSTTKLGGMSRDRPSDASYKACMFAEDGKSSARKV
jgi:hypothetical protein